MPFDPSHEDRLPPGAVRPTLGGGETWRPAGWVAGLPALAWLCALAIAALGPGIESEIRRGALRLAEGDPNGPLSLHQARVEVEGRDVRIVADPGLPAEARGAIARGIAGLGLVRRIRSEADTETPLVPFVVSASRDGAGIRLEGGVPNAAERARLVALAGRVVGVDRVDDRLGLALGAPPHFSGAAETALTLVLPLRSGRFDLSDRRITLAGTADTRASYRAIRSAVAAPPPGYVLIADAVLPPRAENDRFSVEWSPDGLALSGFVPSEAVAEAAESAARGAGLGSNDVRNEMEAGRGLPPDVDHAGMLRALLPSVAGLRSGRIGLEHGRVTIRGETVARLEAATIRDAARAALASAGRTGTVEVSVVPAVPYRLSARRDGGAVHLSGFVPNENVRDALAASLRERFPGDRIVGRAIVADGAPERFDEVLRLVLPLFARTADGTLLLDDASVRLSGRILYAQLAERTRQTFGRDLPGGWSAEVAIESPPPERALDANQCADLLGDLVARRPVRFTPDKPEIADGAGPQVEAFADVVRRCGSTPIRIVHRGGSDAAAADLSAERARTLAAALRSRVPSVRLTVERSAAVPRGATGTDPVFAVGDGASD